MRTIKLIVITIELLILVIIYINVYIILSRYRIKKLEEKLQKIQDDIPEEYKKYIQDGLIDKYLRKNEGGYFSYDRIKSLLKSKGNPLKVTPGGYIASKILLSFIFFNLVGLSGNFFWGLIAGILGFFVIDIYMNYKNHKDMEIIKLELADVYDLLTIQTAAGVFIGDALTEAFLIAKYKRFKIALAELSAEINLTKNIEKALDNFTEHFNSVEIDGLVLTIKQSLITGKAQEAIEDMANSIKETNLIAIQENTNKVSSSKNTIQVLMYIGILGLVLFAIFIELGRTWTGFFGS